MVILSIKQSTIWSFDIELCNDKELTLEISSK